MFQVVNYSSLNDQSDLALVNNPTWVSPEPR